MKPLVFSLPGSEGIASRVAAEIDGQVGERTLRRFPDGETYLRLLTEVQGRDVVVVASLHHPDPKIIPLVLLLETATELGARQVGLVAPYLCYLRQDRRFEEGEAVSAQVFPRFLGRCMDWLVTIDPHLHRIHDLDDVYSVPTTVVHAAPTIARWIAEHVERPLLVGPDAESEQWVTEVAARAGAPWIVLDKVRHGDRDVEVSVPDVARWADRTPVLVDDIISTGRTMIETLGHLERAGLRLAICIGVHGLFSDPAVDALMRAGAAQVVTCDTVEHPTNTIGVAPALAAAVLERL